MQYEEKNLRYAVIDALRFPLMCCVVWIHCAFMNYSMEVGVSFVDMEHYPIYTVVSLLLAENVARVAVPMFFFISGWLLFREGEEWSWRMFGGKLKRRFRTLLLPYLLWNLLYAVLYWGMQMIFPSLFSERIGALGRYSFLEWIALVWGIGPDSGGPIASQFWFVRDLMVLIFFSPLLYALFCRKMGRFADAVVVLLLVLYIFPINGNTLSEDMFFVLGVYCGVRRVDVVLFAKRLFPLLIMTYVVIVSCSTFLLARGDVEVGMCFTRLGVLVGILAVFGGVARWIFHKGYVFGSIWTRSSFFLFAYHAMLTPLCGKLALRFLPYGADVGAVMVYCGISLLVVFLGVGGYYVCSVIAPSMTRWMTGGR